MSANSNPIVLPRAYQLKALGEAVMGATAALRSIASTLPQLESGQDVTTVAIIRTLTREAEAALAPWNVE